MKMIFCEVKCWLKVGNKNCVLTSRTLGFVSILDIQTPPVYPKKQNRGTVNSKMESRPECRLFGSREKISCALFIIENWTCYFWRIRSWDWNANYFKCWEEVEAVPPWYMGLFDVWKQHKFICQYSSYNCQIFMSRIFLKWWWNQKCCISYYTFGGHKRYVFHSFPKLWGSYRFLIS